MTVTRETDRLHVAVIVGSTRPGRFAPTVAAWLTERIRARDDMAVDVVDLAEVRLPDLLDPPPATVTEVGERLLAADAFAVVTPEYNHSFPAALKNAVDWFYAEWRAKPVGYVSYGGVSGGLRAVEQLRLVFNELHATSVRTSVTFANFPDRFDGDGRPKDAALYERSATAMLDELAWWAGALRAHRRTTPYAPFDGE